MTPYEDFLGAKIQSLLPHCCGIERVSRDDSRADLPARDPEKPSTCTSDRRMTLLYASLLRCKRNDPSAGILTCCPSSTPFDLDLGPTDPELTNIAQGNLRFSARRILTDVIATYSDILTSKRSSTPYGMPSWHFERSPTTSGSKLPSVRDCGDMLEPRGVFGAGTLGQ